MNDRAKRIPGGSAKWIALSGVLLLAALFALINLSAPLARRLSKVPVLKVLVYAGLLDKEPVSTVKGVSGQRIDKSLMAGNVRLDVHEAVLSGGNIILHCDLQWFGDIPGVPFVSRFELLEDGVLSPASGATFIYDKESNRSSGTFELQTKSADITKVAVHILEVQYSDQYIERGDWSLSFYMDKEKAGKSLER